MITNQVTVPQHRRDRAEKARARAQRMIEPVTKGMMVEVAEYYESLVRRAEKRLPASQKLIKSEIVYRIAAQIPRRYRRDAEKIVNVILGEIVAALFRGDRVEIRGLGAFSIKKRRGPQRPQPADWATDSGRQKSVPHFKAGKEMRGPP